MQNKGQHQSVVKHTEDGNCTDKVVVHEINTSTHCLEDTSVNKPSKPGKHSRLSLSPPKHPANICQQQNTTTQSKGLAATPLKVRPGNLKHQPDADPGNIQTTSTDLQNRNQQAHDNPKPSSSPKQQLSNQATNINQQQNTSAISALLEIPNNQITPRVPYIT